MDEKELHLERAKKALESAKLLQSKGFVEDAFSRAYYSLLHSGIALLVGIGETPPKTHGGLVAKLFSSLEKLGLSREVLRRFSRFQALRESGDYAPLPAVMKSDLAEIIVFAEEFLKKAGGVK